jgi:hypothetical protein
MTIEVTDRASASHLCAIVKGLYLYTTFQNSHTEAAVIVPEAENRHDLVGPWFLFNDFAVRNVPESEALSFPDEWKVRSSLLILDPAE